MMMSEVFCVTLLNLNFLSEKTWMKKCVEEEDDDDEENDHQTYKEVKQATNKPLGTE